MSDPYNRRDIFKEILALNPTISYIDIVQITSRPESTVFKWMSGVLEPDLFAMFLLKHALVRAGLRIPRDLYRCVDLYSSRAISWGIKNATGDKAENIGNLKVVQNKKYLYNGQLLSSLEIAALSNKNIHTIRGVLTKFDNGADVTGAINRIKADERGRPHKVSAP